MNFWELLFGTGNRVDRNNPPPQSRQRYQVFTYRTEDGDAYFKFSYHWVGNGYEIDIHEQPSYGGRNADSETAHWLISRRDANRKICIKRNALPKTLEDAKKFSMAFAELTWEYIKTGVSIDSQVAMNHQNKNT
ncbi:hypothetical protein L0P88_13720 [Muricauda sp. SCSIO 64092]|uniref:hypothetical protein n=1 Tax=Allomuricauda sp. SCSIO 64092 TaxID=2908842 RepID=UPI001FF5A1BB|nr:hypothetical protein [Muricauda sp. SCSIO 64092]UOY05010.1 hypothetical protein L0P88_13720 [Muricauda sp. SCSIO 64092]